MNPGLQEALKRIEEERRAKTGTLDIGCLSLDEIPTEVFTLTHLRVLNLGWAYDSESGDRKIAISATDLGRNRFASLHPSLANLKQLISLSIFDTQVIDLAPLRNLTLLQRLDCFSTRVSNLEPLSELTALQSLDFSRTYVTDLTPLRKLTELQKLMCYDTKIVSLVPLRGLTALQKLDCSDTKVSDLAPLHDLTALLSLDCSNTQVADLAPLRDLTALQSLDCHSTWVADLEPLRNLTALQSLNCSFTQVADLASLRKLTALQELDCVNTPIPSLVSLRNITALQRLYLDWCPVTSVPEDVLFKSSLEYLSLHETKLFGVPAEVLSKLPCENCLQNLRDHFKDLQQGAETLKEAKLIALGNGRVGKTQICRRLRGLPYDDKIPSTHGISVTSAPWVGGKKGEVLNIWDFGGQDIYHGTHALFMKTRAVFLLVWEPRSEQERDHEHGGLVFRNYPLSYWLEYIRTLAHGGSPVVIVQSQCDKPKNEIRDLPVEKKFLSFEFCKPCWFSAKTDHGKDSLNEAIGEAITHLREKEGKIKIGKGRLRVMRTLEDWRNKDSKIKDRNKRCHRTLTQEQFRALCENDVSSTESLLDFLHNTGVVFYQPDLFRDAIILDQSWALDAVYAVFERGRTYKPLMELGGFFTRHLLALLVWQDYADDEQKLFLSLMQSCGICFCIRKEDAELGVEAEYVAPDLLPGKDAIAAKLAAVWNAEGIEARLEYAYPFLHPGLMRGIVCDAGAIAGEAGLYWRYGVFVFEKDTGCRAIIEQELNADGRGGKIIARIQGERSEKLARWIRERIARHSQVFGYADLKPVTDTFPALPRDGERLKGDDTVAACKGMASTGAALQSNAVPGDGLTPVAPAFALPPSTAFPVEKKKYFISYAWGDKSPEGIQRGKVVNDFCAAMEAAGIKIHRDCQDMKVGTRISEFMERLADGDFIITVISDKYLKSEACMYELFKIFQNCRSDPDRFVKKIIPLVLPDAKIGKIIERLAYARYWNEEKEAVDKLGADALKLIGPADLTKYKLMCEFALNTSEMLAHLNDILVPRDFVQMTADGFKEIRKLLESSAEPPKA